MITDKHTKKINIEMKHYTTINIVYYLKKRAIKVLLWSENTSLWTVSIFLVNENAELPNIFMTLDIKEIIA